MGKKSIIRSLVTSISLVAYHKILYEKGDKHEAKKHLRDEIRDYSTDGFQKAQECKFNKNKLKEIESKAINHTSTVLKTRYPDIRFSEEDVREAVIDTMQEFLLV